MKRRTGILLATILLTAGLLAGCAGKTAQDTKAPAPSQVGIIDVQKAIKAHPKYNHYQQLQTEYNTLKQKVQAEQQAAGTKEAMPTNAQMPDNSAAGMDAVLKQEFDAKMAAKQNELQANLASKAASLRQELGSELKAYTAEVDKTYQPQIFSLQLKLKTLQLSKEEMAAIQSQLDALQQQRNAKISAKEQELSARMDKTMTAEKAAAENALSAYAKDVNNELAQKAAAKQAELAARTQTMVAPAPAAPADGRSEAEQQLELKQQELTALKNDIIKDIEDKTAKVAAEQGLEAVLAQVKVNINAVDVTDAVIAEFKN